MFSALMWHKLLYVAKRVKPEMLAAVSFLTTQRALAPDIDDLAKLNRALGLLESITKRCEPSCSLSS